MNTPSSPTAGSARTVWAVTASALLLGLFVAPWTHNTDFENGWVLWERASGGRAPWDIYLHAQGCNYPPFCLYLLTLAEGLQQWWRQSPLSPGAIAVIKLPNLLAILGGVALCLRGLRPPFGDAFARRAALAYALCLPLWFNAAVWGQYEALLSLAMVAAVIALLNDRPLWGGAALGWALSMKLQSVILVPALLVFLYRRRGVWGVAAAAAAGALVWGLVALPYFLHGAGHGVAGAYTGAVGFFTWRSWSGYNGWYLLDSYDTLVRHLPPTSANLDTNTFHRLLTYRQIGLLAYSLYTLWVMAVLWRRPTGLTLLFVATMGAYGFFMLPTQMHERYLVPAVALAALLAPAAPRLRWLFLGMATVAFLNEFFAQGTLYPHPIMAQMARVLGEVMRFHLDDVLSLLNVALFVWASLMLWRHGPPVEDAPAGGPKNPSPAQA